MEELKSTLTGASPVALTERALTEIRSLRDKQGLDGTAILRIGVKGGGCAGFEYILEFDQVVEGDRHYKAEDLNYVVHPDHEEHLKGTEIDFKRGLDNRGFTFGNPNASSTCGCGSSFG